jgi:hypothetical protein
MPAPSPPNRIQRDGPPRPEADGSLEALALKLLEARRGKRAWAPPSGAGRMVERIVDASLGRAGSDGSGTRRMAAMLASLRLRWPQIVGEKLAALCQPDALRKDALVLRTSSAAAPLLQMRAGELLGLVALAGGPQLKKLVLVRAPLHTASRRSGGVRARPLAAAEAAELDRRLEPVGSARLKEAIRNLAILARQEAG